MTDATAFCLAAWATCLLAAVFDGLHRMTWAPFWLAAVGSIFAGAFR